MLGANLAHCAVELSDWNTWAWHDWDWGLDLGLQYKTMVILTIEPVSIAITIQTGSDELPGYEPSRGADQLSGDWSVWPTSISHHQPLVSVIMYHMRATRNQPIRISFSLILNKPLQDMTPTECPLSAFLLAQEAPWTQLLNAHTHRQDSLF